jgi:hypothetical protein
MTFFSNRFGSYVRRPPSTVWREISQFHYLSDDEIIESLQLSAKLHRAVRLNNAACFIIISIPSSSPYRNSDQIARLRDSMKSRSINTVLYQSDEDWHLYIFFKHQILVNNYAQLIRKWTSDSGFNLSDETLQVFDSDSVVPLPLHSEFSWLNDLCQVTLKRSELTLEESIQHFLKDSIRFANDPEAFLAAFRQLDDCLAQPSNETVDSDTPTFSPRMRMLPGTDSSLHLIEQPLLNEAFENDHLIYSDKPLQTTAATRDSLHAFSDLSKDQSNAPSSDEPIESNNSPTLQHLKTGCRDEQITRLLVLPTPRSSHPTDRLGKSTSYPAKRSSMKRAPPDTG